MPKTFRNAEELRKHEAYLHIHKIPHQYFESIHYKDGSITIIPVGGNHLEENPYIPVNLRSRVGKI